LHAAVLDRGAGRLAGKKFLKTVLSIEAPISAPKTFSWPPARTEPLPRPLLSTTKIPPELIVVASAVPPESTNIVPPLTTVSPLSV
jgi:hypothetical protein